MFYRRRWELFQSNNFSLWIVYINLWFQVRKLCKEDTNLIIQLENKNLTSREKIAYNFILIENINLNFTLFCHVNLLFTNTHHFISKIKTLPIFFEIYFEFNRNIYFLLYIILLFPDQYKKKLLIIQKIFRIYRIN